MEKQLTTKQLFSGALLLTIAGLASKVLSAGYRIPLQNITGDYGFYIYQQIYPFIGIAMMLSLYGFPAAISKVVSERKEGADGLSLQSFYLPVIILLSSLCGIIFCGLFNYAPVIARWMGDESLIVPLKFAAVAFLLVPFTSLVRGIFQGLHNMKPTALSQIIEQLVRVTIIIVAAIWIVRNGRSLYDVGNGAALASVLGAIVTTIFLLTLWWIKRPVSSNKYRYRWRTYLNVIVVHGIFIGINHMVLLLFQLSDAFTLVPNLMEYGYNGDNARAWKGIFDRGYPLIQLGTVIGSSLAMALIPSITTNRLNRNQVQFQAHIHSMVKLSTILSAGATVGLTVLFPFVNTLLFQDEKGSISLAILTSTILVASLAITTATILQGLGYITTTAIFVLVSVIIKGLLNMTLVPLFGIMGGSISTVLSAVCLLLLNVIMLKKVMPSVRIFVIPFRVIVTSLLVMITYLLFLNHLIFPLLQVSTRIGYLGFVLFAVFTGAFIYLLILIRQSAFNEEELQALPLGELLLEMTKRR